MLLSTTTKMMTVSRASSHLLRLRARVPTAAAAGQLSSYSAVSSSSSLNITSNIYSTNINSNNNSIGGKRFAVGHKFKFDQLKIQFYSTTPISLNKQKEDDEVLHDDDDDDDDDDEENALIYEGPFASLSKRLKRISLASAVASIIGIPLLITFHSGDVPASGQLAVGSTAILAATGSTLALTFCFSPYVNALTYVDVDVDADKNVTDNDNDTASDTNDGKTKRMIKATTTNILAMEKVTIFDPLTDVTQPSSSSTSTTSASTNYRPFCNFLIKDEPFYIHPELLHDDELRVLLVGKEKGTLVQDHNDDEEYDEEYEEYEEVEGDTNTNSNDGNASDDGKDKKKKTKKNLDDDFL